MRPVGSQMPARPAWLHFSHSPLQADAQQTPSTQLPVMHSAPTTHGHPCAFLQNPSVHENPVWQGADALHDVRHCPLVASHV